MPRSYSFAIRSSSSSIWRVECLAGAPPAVVAEIDRLFDEYTAEEVAPVLNRNGVVSGASAG
jgi:hypothetical protein